MHGTRRNATAALLALAVAVAAGCGGSDKPAPMTKASYIAKADAICKKANQAETAIGLGAGGESLMGSGEFDDVQLLDQVTVISNGALRELRALTPPAGSRQTATATLDSIQRMVRALEDHVAELRRGKQPHRAQQLKDYGDGYSDLAVNAGRLGLSECQGLME